MLTRQLATIRKKPWKNQDPVIGRILLKTPIQASIHPAWCPQLLNSYNVDYPGGVFEMVPIVFEWVIMLYEIIQVLVAFIAVILALNWEKN